MKTLCVLFSIFIIAASLSAQGNSAQTQPTFSAAGMDGRKIDLADLKGKVVVINLWFINCPNCIEEIKLLNKLVDDYKSNKDVVFLGLAASKKPDLEKFLRKNPFAYQIIPDATMIIISRFGTPDKNGNINIPFPMHYVLDQEGKILVKTQGIKGVEAVRKELVKQFPARSGAAR